MTSSFSVYRLCCVYNLCIWHLCIWYWHKNVSFTSNYLTTELAHSKLKNGLFSRVISCHDRSTQNCQNSCSKCVQRTWTQALRRCLSFAYVHCVCRHKRLDNDTFLASLSRFKKATVLCSRCAEAPSCRNAKKLNLGQPVYVWQRPVSMKVVATVCPLYFWHKKKSNQIVINPVLGKNLEHCIYQGSVVIG